jgi:hypothetical protein
MTRTEAWASAARRAILAQNFSTGRFAMSILSRLDAKFGRYAVPNVTVLIIIGQVFAYVAQRVSVGQPGLQILERIRLDPALVLTGEYWRLVTFVFNPPISNLLFAVFTWYLLYLMGTTLEVTWGTFRYDVYLLIGYLGTIVAAFIGYFTAGPVLGMDITNGFLCGTILLAFARFFPEFTIYTMFIPIKIRWLAMAQWAAYGYYFLIGPGTTRAIIVASVANYLLFFGSEIWQDIKHAHRRTRFHARTLQGPRRIVHVCGTCGITSDDAPHMQFRYCSKCDGDKCYCPAHLREHEHVVATAVGSSETTSG